MEKYAIKLVKDDDNTILELFASKEEALAAGVKYRERYTREQGLISCIKAEFDDDNNIVGNRYKLINSWR